MALTCLPAGWCLFPVVPRIGLSCQLVLKFHHRGYVPGKGLRALLSGFGSAADTLVTGRERRVGGLDEEASMSTQGMQRDGEAITQVRAKLSVGAETTQ